MAAYGLGNYLYEVTFDGKTANYHFYDPEDATNTADVSLSPKDFPNGSSADSRDTADLAFSQCSKLLNDKRDARVQKEVTDEEARKLSDEQASRAAADEFLGQAKDAASQPSLVTKDDQGRPLNVYSGVPGSGVPETSESGSDSSSSDKSKK